MLETRRLTKTYKDAVVLSKVSISVEEGELLTILGPSGSGKSTLLNLIAGVKIATSGTICLNGVDITDLPIHMRNLGVVFQGYSLFPHLNIYKNIAFPLTTKIHNVPKHEIKNRVNEILEIVGLKGLEKRMPDEISGGQKQRVALARALIHNPSILLLDEPLAALDKNLKKQMQKEIRDIQKQLKKAILYITHDQEEALNMADRIVLLNFGKIEQIGYPEEIYNRPTNEFVLNFFGESNKLDGFYDGTKFVIRGCTSDYLIFIDKKGIQPDSPLSLYIRPENIKISLEKPIINMNYINVKIVDRCFFGDRVKYLVVLPNCDLWTIYTEPFITISVEARIIINWEANKSLFFNHQTYENF